jgi:hypothetical protein
MLLNERERKVSLTVCAFIGLSDIEILNNICDKGAYHAHCRNKSVSSVFLGLIGYKCVFTLLFRMN